MNFEFKNKVGLICGASRGIGLALVKSILQSQSVKKVYACVRDSNNSELNILKEQYPDHLSIIELDLTIERDYQKVADIVKSSTDSLDFIINSVAILKFNEQTPERRIEDVSSINLLKSFEVNTVPTLLLAKAFKPLLRNSQAPLFCAISAKVGSIDDNNTGGWYGYRMSKAALSMALRNLSIEFKRLNNNLIVVSIHPGTTETDLSKPFIEAAKKKYTIHSPEQTATNIIGVLKEAKNGQFLSWDKTEIKW